jgi:hypothetical protein
MRYADFEHFMSSARMSRYRVACGGNSKKAMTLYRMNLRLSQELFTIISCFEVTLRNAINNHCLASIGSNWLQNSASPGGNFDNWHCHLTADNINEAIHKLGTFYSHNKLVAELGFGFWRYMFAQYQYTATGRSLLRIFPARPTSSFSVHYNQTFVFNQLAQINNLRNRVAHHEPICFISGHPVINTSYVRQHYSLIRQFFQWMSFDEAALLYGLDHIIPICNQIDAL